MTLLLFEVQKQEVFPPHLFYFISAFTFAKSCLCLFIFSCSTLLNVARANQYK